MKLTFPTDRINEVLKNKTYDSYHLKQRGAQ